MNRIKITRINSGLSQSGLADKLNVKQNTVSYWESGRNEPDFASLLKMAEIFGVSVDYLIGGNGQKEPATIADDGLSDLDRELISMLCQLSPEDARRVKDFVAGLKAAREE